MFLVFIAFLCTFTWLNASRHIFELVSEAYADASDARRRMAVDWKQGASRPGKSAKRGFLSRK